MPAPNPSLVLDDPPPLTPAALRNFPYRFRTFPLNLIPSASVAPEANARPEESATSEAVE